MEIGAGDRKYIVERLRQCGLWLTMEEVLTEIRASGENLTLQEALDAYIEKHIREIKEAFGDWKMKKLGCKWKIELVRGVTYSWDEDEPFNKYLENHQYRLETSFDSCDYPGCVYYDLRDSSNNLVGSVRFYPNFGKEQPTQVLMAGGKAASTPIPPLHLIPTIALEKLAERFQLGIERKGDKSWNALSNNQECLEDVEFLIDRLGHIIHHALKLRDKLKDQDIEKIKQDDDAGAIAWGGVFLICAIQRLLEKENENGTSTVD